MCCESLYTSLARFWDAEEIPRATPLSLHNPFEIHVDNKKDVLATPENAANLGNV